MTAATEGKPGIYRLLRRLVLWQVGWLWYLLVLIGVPAIVVLGFLTLPGAMASLHLSSFPQLVAFFPIFLLLEIFTSGLAEEPGWRGFALPRLQDRFGPLSGTVILGLLWGAGICLCSLRNGQRMRVGLRSLGSCFQLYAPQL